VGFIIFIASPRLMFIAWVLFPCVMYMSAISLSLWLRTMNPQSHSIIFIGIFMCDVTSTPPQARVPRGSPGYHVQS